MKQILNQLIEHKTLDKATAKRVLIDLANGAFNNSQVAAFMTIYMMRAMTVEELEGFRDAMLELCVALDLSEYDPIDLCGTGGDGKDTFNISTLSSFVVAGAGQTVAKHGNNGVSSICGSSNLLAHFGYQFTNDPDQVKSEIEKANICFLHAPLFHPAMKNVAPIRKELGVKTFFNMLGPMVNPAFPKKQLVGVFSLELARLYGYLYQKANKSFVILHALDGYDEVSLTGNFKMISNEGEKILSPERLGLPRVLPEAIAGGTTVEESAKIFLKILEGKGSEAQRAVVVANAGLALYASNQDEGIETALERAAVSLDSGKALNSFNKLIKN